VGRYSIPKKTQLERVVKKREEGKEKKKEKNVGGWEHGVLPIPM
jgi:hypothetical protein